MYHFKVTHIPLWCYQLSGGGKNRRCAYNDGDSHDLSLVDLRKLTPCTDKNCALASSTTKINEYINKHRPRPNEKEDGDGAPNYGDDDEEEEEANDDDKEEDGSGDDDVVLPKGRIAKKNNRVLHDGPNDDDSNLYTSGDRKKSPPADSDEESLFGSDSEESHDNDNNSINSAGDDDEKSLFSDSDHDPQGNTNSQNEDDGDGSSTSSRFSNDPFDVPNLQQVRPPKREVVEKKLKITKALGLVTEFHQVPEIKETPTSKCSCSVEWCSICFFISHHDPGNYLADIYGDRMIKRCLPLGSGPPPEITELGGFEYKIMFSEVIARKGKVSFEDSCE